MRSFKIDRHDPLNILRSPIYSCFVLILTGEYPTMKPNTNLEARLSARRNGHTTDHDQRARTVLDDRAEREAA